MLHDEDGDGTIFTYSRSGGDLRQRTWPVSDLFEAIASLDPHCDGYLSQASFSGARRQAGFVQSVRAMWTDLDYYHVEGLEAASASEIVTAAHCLCDEIGLPRPSMVVDSGRGLQLKWRLAEPVVQSGLPDWKSAMIALGKVFIDLGTDMKCQEPARILRVVGTINTKSDRIVEVLESSEASYFLSEFTTVLPEAVVAEPTARKPKVPVVDPGVDDWEYPDRPVVTREPVVAAPVVKDKSHRTPAQIEAEKHLVKSTPAILWTDRREDLYTLALMRDWQTTGVNVGYRHLFLFLMALSLVRSGRHATLEDEVRFVASVYTPDLPDADIRAVIHRTLDSKFHAYRYQNSTLIDQLSITADEMKGLKTIISEEEEAERHRVRHRKGNLDRAGYLSASVDLTAKVLALHQQGLDHRAISGLTDLTIRAVRYRLQLSRPTGTTTTGQTP